LEGLWQFSLKKTSAESSETAEVKLLH